jgi:HEAT repeat protein
VTPAGTEAGMKKLNVFLVFAALAGIAGCGGSDPVLNGRPLSEWLRDLDSNDLAQHLAAVEGLAQAGEEAAPALVEAIEDSNEADDNIRCGAAHALLRIDARKHLPAILEQLDGDDPRLTVNMATAMIRANVEPGRAVESMIEIMQQDDLRLYNYGIKALSDLGPESCEAAPVLGRLAKGHPNADVRRRAAYSLVRLGPAGKAAVPDLLEAIEDEDHRVREGAAFALGAIQEQDPRVVASLETALNDPNASVRLRAARALERLRT